MFRHTVSSNAVEIDAPAERAWQVLTDFERYGEWNPFTTRVGTTLEIGAPVDMHVWLGPLPVRQAARISAIEPPRLLAWGVTMGPRWLLVAHREQRLEELGDSRCRYVTSDAFNGLLVPLLVLLVGGFIRRGFDAMGAALKARAESSAGR